MHGQIGTHRKSSIFAIAITEFAAKCELTAGLNAPGIGRSQEIRGNSRPGRESKAAAGAVPRKALDF